MQWGMVCGCSVRRHMLAALPIFGLSLGGLLVASGPAMAQEGEEIETVVVTGYQQTIESSIEAKRTSTVIADMLTTKDIGDLPSLSIGSALESLTGAAGAPDNTGATEFSFRGLGAYLGLTVFNGREITNGSGDRAVNFSIFPSELMTGLKLYKSQQASFVEGAVSAQAALELAHPLDFEKRVFQAELKGSYSPYAYRVRSGRKGPGLRGTVTYIDQFDLGEYGQLGFSIGMQHDETNNPQERYLASSTIYACDPTTSSKTCDQISREDAAGGSDFMLVPSSYSFYTNEDESQRNAVFADVQWRPFEGLTVNIDGEFSGYYTNQYQQALIINDGLRYLENAVYSASHVTEYVEGQTRLVTQPKLYERNEIYTGGGVNVDWDVTDKLNLSFDYGYSHTFRPTIQRMFLLYSGTLKSNGTTTASYVDYTMDARNGVIPSFDFGDFDLDDASNFIYYPRWKRYNQTRFDTISAYRFDAAYKVGGLISKVEAGIRFSNRAYRDFYDKQDNALGATAAVYATTVDAIDSCQVDFPIRDYLHVSGNTVHSWASFDPLCLFKKFTGTRDPGDSDDLRSVTNNDVREQVWAAYVMATYALPFGEHTIAGNFGGRLVHTRVISDGLRSDLTLISNSDGSYTMSDTGDFTAVETRGSSMRFLPSINLTYDISEDLMLRGAISRTMARPAPSALGAGLTISLNSGDFTSPEDAISSVTASGNPKLKPLMSWNYDVALEYYMNKDSMFTADVYYYRFQGGYKNQLQNTSLVVDGVDVVAPVTEITNSSRRSYVYGLEVNAVTTFTWLPHPLEGLGVKVGYNFAQANFKNDDVDLGDLTDPETGDVTPGMIPSANMTGYSPHVISAQLFYGIGNFDAQVVYQYRSHWYQDFLGGNTQLRYFRANERLDLRATYTISRHLSLQANVYNALNSPTIMDMPVVGSLRDYSKFGSRYYMSLKYRM